MKIFRTGPLSGADVVQWLTEMRRNACIPELDFAVTAVFRAGVPGDAADYYFSGVNVQSIDHRINNCGEEACIAAMVTGLGKHAEIREVWIMGAPKAMKAGDKDPSADALVTCCGGCRQQISGFAGKDVRVHSVSLNGKMTTTTVGAFLPDAFNLPPSGHAKDIKSFSNAEIMNRIVRKGNLTDRKIFDWLQNLESVDEMSSVSQSIVLRLDNGAYVAGTKVENVAFDDLSAAQAAVAIAISEFGAVKIEEAWCYTKGRGGHEVPRGHFAALALSALQTLVQTAGGNGIPLHFFTDDGDSIRMTLSEAAGLVTTSESPWQKRF